MNKTLRIIFIVFLSLLILGTAGVAIFIGNIMSVSNKVEFDKNRLLLVNADVLFYDNENNIASENYSNKNTVALTEIPLYVQEAFISIEDKNFYEHHGLNYKRMIAAMWNNIKSRDFVEGASTISQQLIKNTHLSSEKTISRKVEEILLTRRLEKEFTKEDILETYLNVIYFGEGSYGIADASLTYFDKSPSDLTLAEGAMLAGMIKAPARYSPVYNSEKCFNRRNLVLKEMLKDGAITHGMYDEAVGQGIELNLSDTKKRESLYYRACLQEASNILGLSEKEIALSGIKLYTYLDADKQETLENLIKNDNYYEENRYGNISDSLAIIVNNKTYGIEAFAGKSDYNLTNFNRQPGSAIKPILVYAPALESGQIAPSTQILDEETDFDGYIPHNVGGFHGYVSASEAVALSLNIPTVKVFQEVGIDKAKSFAERAGVRFSDKDNGLALALGGFTDGISLKELVGTYLPFSTLGYYRKTSFIRQIVDNNGLIIYDNSKPSTQIMGDDSAFLMTQMLIDGVKTGTSKKLVNLPYQVAGKTGTVVIPGTNDNSDAISVAYTTEHTMGVWMRNYSNDSEHELDHNNNGGTYATAMIRDAFKYIYSENYPANFDIPDSVIKRNIDVNELEENHNVCLENNTTAERYVKPEYFAKRYLPAEENTLYNDLSLKDFDVVVHGNQAEITFTPKRYLTYKVYRLDNSNERLVGVFTEKDNEVICEDNNLKANTRYRYYVEISSNQKTARTDYITILTDYECKKYEDIIESQQNNDIIQDSTNWIFMSN